MAAAYASLQRIQEFLIKDEKPETPAPLMPKTRPSTESSDEKESTEKVDIHELGFGEKHMLIEESLSGIIMESASFAWAPDAEAFLQDLSLNLSEDKLYMCVGPVASVSSDPSWLQLRLPDSLHHQGKTLLLLSILGETIRKSGFYNSPSTRIAYAAQDALIVPGTVRENITFGCEYDETWYNLVLDACALRPDLKKMKSGDGTMLGEKGRRLSGGQKQRIVSIDEIYIGRVNAKKHVEGASSSCIRPSTMDTLGRSVERIGRRDRSSWCVCLCHALISI